MRLARVGGVWVGAGHVWAIVVRSELEGSAPGTRSKMSGFKNLQNKTVRKAANTNMVKHVSKTGWNMNKMQWAVGCRKTSIHTYINSMVIGVLNFKKVEIRKCVQM
ncbi:hypothetical protein PF010_g4618 [Phytophthora fragariae]|uniref:Uncharacterized protein n=1 Tax=Phytophthora fragariae TaxID=53985 RepID=A0A6G0LR15_9STRA|nr:hypothetical protein PF010_g4618 [Phytophthora fragariae]KAE9247657.1 hypothetical protein PF004_g4220 [Phytophthora fragariae]